MTASVVSTSLTSSQAAIDHFTVNFSAPLSASSAVVAVNYDLRTAGPDGVFGTADDTVLSLTPTYAAGSTTVTFAVNPEPLQPNLPSPDSYRFETLSGLLDQSGAAVTPYTTNFTVTNPVDGQIAWTTHGSEFVPGATPLPMTQVSSGFLTALGVGSFASTSDVNYWYFNASAGDQLSVRVEAQSYGGGSVYPQLLLQNVSGSTIQSATTTSSGSAEFDSYTFGSSGEYFLKVYSNNSVGSYQMRVDQSLANTGPQLDSTPNNTQSTAMTLNMSSASFGNYSGSVSGALPVGDSGDYYGLGVLSAGNAISLTVTAPSISSLYTGAGTAPSVNLSIFAASGGPAVATSTTGSLTYTVPSGQSGSYFVLVQRNRQGANRSGSVSARGHSYIRDSANDNF